MLSIQLKVTITIPGESADAFADLIVHAIERGTARCVRESSKPSARPHEVTRPAPVPKQTVPEDELLLIDTQRACKLLGVSPRKLWQMYNSGEMPAPIRIGRAVRWSHEELRAWVEAGCPPQNEWKRMRSGRE